ncbi:MAG TPA: glycosyltransferase, partial [Desulfobacteria bacterium]|nr:glycosyltransferase [Desulfobacteria bacterium]
MPRHHQGRAGRRGDEGVDRGAGNRRPRKEGPVKITAIVITRNEERNIGDCLASIPFVDEVIVVDSGSSDRTEEICRRDPRVRWFSE